MEMASKEVMKEQQEAEDCCHKNKAEMRLEV